MTVEESAALYGAPFQSYRLHNSPQTVMECRPISLAPEKMVAIMYRRDGDKLRQSGVGKVKDGRWVSSSGQPLEGDRFWTVLVDD
jgi:hypothetical protein